ncbi:MAG: WD40/YVTN/BNR-like repeat-containing protein [Flavisolibacter sp.]
MKKSEQCARNFPAQHLLNRSSKRAFFSYWLIPMLCLFSVLTSQAQTWHAPAQDDITGSNPATSNTILSVYFINSSRGWAVGQAGIIYTTANGGSTWTAQNSGTTEDLWSVYFTTATNGWSVGSNGDILRTTDGGSNWTIQSNPPANLTSINFSGTQALATGLGGLIMHSPDGISWTPGSSGTGNDLYGVYSIGSQSWAVGTGGTILTSADGVSWTTRSSGTPYDLYSVFFITATKGWAVGMGGVIVTTNDGGVSWSPQPSPTTYDLNNVYFTSPNQGWAVGQSGVILTTSNGGITWINVTSGITDDLYGLYFTSPIQGCAVGGLGTVLLYNCKSASASLTGTAQTLTQDAARINFYGSNSCNNYIAKLSPSGASPVSGNVTAKVWIESTQPSGFVKRHYEITPATSASTATGKVTLYFTQQDFTDFNAVSSVKLPIDGTDAANNKSHLLIEKRSGTSNNGTGLPGSYTSSVITIDPADANIVWNNAASRWEVTIDVTGFSGFFAKTSTSLLPVKLVRFSATKKGSTNLLQWTTATEINSDHFEVASGDGRVFAPIGSVKAGGNTANQTQYSFEDRLPGASHNFYRLKMVDQDGRFEYSDIVSVSNDNIPSITVYPVPAGNTLYLSGANNGASYRIENNSGQQVQTGKLANNGSLAIGSLAPGLFILSIEGQHVKFVKQ